MCDILKSIYNIIGLANKAGKVSSGTLAVKNSLGKRKARLLIMSNDIADRSKEGLITDCNKRNVPWLVLGSKYDLGLSIGKTYRVAVTINDANFAQSVIDKAQSKGFESIKVGVVEWLE